MKVRLINAEIAAGGSRTMVGGQLTGPLNLATTPVAPSEAVSRQYVETSIVNIPADNIRFGTLPTGRLPAFTGDITTSLGSTITGLVNSGVVPGTYTAVTVNEKGIVTVGGNLLDSDLPNMNFSRVSIDRPTTLAGYGITDALNVANGTMTGQLTLHADPVGNTDVSTRAYVDSLFVPSDQMLNSGDIVKMSTDVTPSGFLRVNGAELDRTTFAGLFSAIGERYSIVGGTVPGSGRPWQQQYDINLDANPTLGTWSTAGNLPIVLSISSPIVTRNRVFLLGGHTNPNVVNAIFTAHIHADGTLGTWTTAGNLPSVLSSSTSIVTRNRVFLLGGWSVNTVVSTIHTAPILADGTLGTWTTAGNLPSALIGSTSIVTRNRVFLLGGHNGSAIISTIFTAPILADGTLGAWTSAGNLPSVLHVSSAIVTRNRVFLLGGATVSGSVSSIFTAPILADGTLGAWTSAGNLPSVLHVSSAIVTRNRVFLLGGHNGSAVISTIFTAPINADGTLGTWTSAGNLPSVLHVSSAIATRNRVFLLGGETADSRAAAISTIFTATLSGATLNDYSMYYDGSIQPTSATTFRLPDYTAQENFSTFFYIKT